jgi:Domain of unknown function (DUF4411)
MVGLVYSVDSSALIHAYRRIYRPKNFGFVWEGFDKLIGEGRFKSSIEVYNELQKKDDELFAWCKERKETMFVEIDDVTQALVAKIMAAHPKLVDTTKGRSGADPFVIALAQSINPQMMVVTEEYPGKERIPDVCDAQKIDHCGIADLIEKEEWTS